MISEQLSWHTLQWRSLWDAYQHQRLPHALLFIGESGLGKKQFAEKLSAAILCRTPSVDGKACGECRGCQLMQAKTHPDFLMVEPEKTGQMIKIEQIREVLELTSSTSMQSGYRIIIIHPASAMNVYAVNALLKTLEEPPAKTLFILINDTLRLPATILSRCQKVFFQKPKTIKTIDLLDQETLELRRTFYENLLTLADDPLKMAALWHEKELTFILNLLLVWLKDILRLKLTNGKALLVNADFETQIKLFSEKIETKKLLTYLSQVEEVYRMISRGLNLNRQLVLEGLFLNIHLSS